MFTSRSSRTSKLGIIVDKFNLYAKLPLCPRKNIGVSFLCLFSANFYFRASADHDPTATPWMGADSSPIGTIIHQIGLLHEDEKGLIYKYRTSKEGGVGAGTCQYLLPHRRRVTSAPDEPDGARGSDSRRRSLSSSPLSLLGGAAPDGTLEPHFYT